MPLDPSLTALELDVIAALAMSRVTASSVTLAADLWRTNENWKAFDVEPIVSLVVRSLGEQNLVRYIDTRPNFPFPCDIRLTPDGWALAGYPNYTPESGTPDRHKAKPKHRDDRTDYKTHGYHAESSPVLREDFETHLDAFPSHIHPLMEDFLMARSERSVVAPPKSFAPGITDEAGVTRGYIHVTPELEAQVLAAKHLNPISTYAQLGEIVSLPPNTVKYILTDLPRLRKTSGKAIEGSLKERIQWLLLGMPESRGFKDASELRGLLGRADDLHDIVHVLHSLHTQGLVDFREAAGREHPTDIRLTARGRGKGLKMKESVAERVHESQQENLPPVEDEPAPMVAVGADGILDFGDLTGDKDDYPLLDELIAREANRQAKDERATAYIQAAEAIRKIDPQAAAELDAKASQNDVPFPSPIEREYLRYVANHTTRDDA